jgi:predicted nuclease of predicted toxin-antitoxin system
MHLLLDQNVANSVAVAFRERGHTVQLVREILPANSPDPLIAAVAELDSYVLVSHDRDFETIAPRIPRGSRARFRRLSRISLECSEAQAAQRIIQTMGYIELAYTNAALAGKGMRVVVQTHGIKVIE